MNKNKIDLFTAILININIMIGAGIFINTKPLTQIAGSFGFFGYILAGLLLFPIALCIAMLAKIHPTAGGLYVYSKKYISPLVGFICGWSYFLGKTASAALLTHIFVDFFYSRIIFMQTLPILSWDCLSIFFLIFLNIGGIRVGGKIQYLFITIKAIPIIFALFVGFSFFNPDLFLFTPSELKNIFSTIPIAIFALVSFEMICSIGHLIKNPEKNIQKAVIISFFIVISVSVLFQMSLFGSLGNFLSQTLESIAFLSTKNFPGHILLSSSLNALVFTSIISGAFGSLTTNCWNLYALAKDKNLPFSNFFTKINRFDAPWTSLISEGLLGSLLLLITKDQIPFQNMTVLGLTGAYFLTCIAAFLYIKKQKPSYLNFVLTSLAILSSTYIVGLSFKNLFIYGLSLSFSIIFLLGIGAMVWERREKIFNFLSH